MNDKNKLNGTAVAWAIGATAVASIVAGVLAGLYYYDKQPFVAGLIAAIVYCPIHLLVGRLVLAILSTLTSLLEIIFKGTREGIEPSAAIVIGAIWPLSLLAIPFMCIALILGLFYRSLRNVK